MVKNEYDERVMELENFKPNDIVKIVIYDCGEGTAIVKSVEQSKMTVQWVCRTTCYSCQSYDAKDDLMEITEDDIKNDIFHTLDLLERTSDDDNAWKLSEKKVLELKEIYDSNKEDLKKIEDFIRENGCTEDGLSDVTESFEQGWNNAFEFVFGKLGINYR